MSGIYISGMEMPTSCFYCPFRRKVDPDDIMCIVTREVFEETFAGTIETRNRGNCPLVPVPEHGRLIDADVFLAEQRHLYCENCARRKGMKNGKMKFVYDIGDAPCRACGYGDVLDDIDDAPTIIPAEEGE